MVYNELRAIASSFLVKESVGHTLQPTALVNEAYLRIASSDATKFNNRQHFFRVASRAMQRILVDQARSKRRLKRGGEATRIPLSDSVLAADRLDTDLLDLDAALSILEVEYPVHAELVRLHVFSGFSLVECAEILEVSQSTIERRWRFARAWLLSRMSDNSSEKSDKKP